MGVSAATGWDAGKIAADSIKPSARVPVTLPVEEVSHVNTHAPYRVEIAARRLRFP